LEAPVLAPHLPLFLLNCPCLLATPWGTSFDPADIKSLGEYFKDFELLAARAHLSDIEKIKYVYQYVLREDVDFWTSLPEFEGVLADWEVYKLKYYWYFS